MPTRFRGYGMEDIEFTDEVKCDLVDSAASDLSVVNAARISFDTEHSSLDNPSDSALINYLMKNRHGSPFEHGYFKFLLEAPIFEFREHVRHRAGHSFNEISGRYTEPEPKFYLPKRPRIQRGKPGAYKYEEEGQRSPIGCDMSQFLRKSYERAWNSYTDLLRLGIAKEQARIILPLGLYTKVIWSTNPRALMSFISLRGDPTAMKEIRSISNLAEEALKAHMPITYQSFIQNNRIAP